MLLQAAIALKERETPFTRGLKILVLQDSGLNLLPLAVQILGQGMEHPTDTLRFATCISKSRATLQVWH